PVDLGRNKAQPQRLGDGLRRPQTGPDRGHRRENRTLSPNGKIPEEVAPGSRVGREDVLIDALVVGDGLAREPTAADDPGPRRAGAKVRHFVAARPWNDRADGLMDALPLALLFVTRFRRRVPHDRSGGRTLRRLEEQVDVDDVNLGPRAQLLE